MSLELLPRFHMASPLNDYPPAEMPSLSYALDIQNKRVRGFVDHQDAMRQAIFKQLQTWLRYHDIYDDDYGFEAQGLLGQDEDFVRCQVKHRIRDALQSDTRILDIKNFRFSPGIQDDSLSLSFLVITRFGEFTWDAQIPITQ